MTLAYLDPGSGSLIISAVVGGAAAAGVAVKQARSKVTGAFRRKPKAAETLAAEPETATAPVVEAPVAETVPPGDPADVVASGDDA